MKQKTKMKLCIALAMMIFGTIGPFTRMVEVTSGELALYRAILAAMLLLVYLFIRKQNIKLQDRKQDVIRLIVSGMIMGINWVLLFQAYRYTSISIATLSYYFAPVIVAVACPILFHEKMSKKNILCFVASTIGMAMIIGVNQESGNQDDLIGVLFGLGAAVFYASVVLMNKKIAMESGIHRTLLQFIGAIIVLLPYVLIFEGVHITTLDQMGWICLLIVGLLHTGVTYVLYFSALHYIDGKDAAILSYIDPLVAVLISCFILHEPMTIYQIIGGILILGFTLWNEKDSVS